MLKYPVKAADGSTTIEFLGDKIVVDASGKVEWSRPATPLDYFKLNKHLMRFVATGEYKVGEWTCIKQDEGIQYLLAHWPAPDHIVEPHNNQCYVLTSRGMFGSTSISAEEITSFTSYNAMHLPTGMSVPFTKVDGVSPHSDMLRAIVGILRIGASDPPCVPIDEIDQIDLDNRPLVNYDGAIVSEIGAIATKQAGGEVVESNDLTSLTLVGEEWVETAGPADVLVPNPEPVPKTPPPIPDTRALRANVIAKLHDIRPIVNYDDGVKQELAKFGSELADDKDKIDALQGEIIDLKSSIASLRDEFKIGIAEIYAMIKAPPTADQTTETESA